MHGLGATDMKGGLAVMIELARWAAEAELAYDLGLLFFPREELGPEHNPLPGVFAAAPLIDEAALVICLEPTDNTLQLGCLGNLNARLVFEGVLGALGAALAGRERREARCRGAARDRRAGAARRRDRGPALPRGAVGHADPRRRGDERDPGARRVHAQLPLRARPHARRGRGARARARRARGRDHAELRRGARREARRPGRGAAAVGDFEVQPKQAWTNVADFAARGLDAVNFGPGATRYAHAVDEQIEIAALARSFEALQRFLVGDAR